MNVHRKWLKERARRALVVSIRCAVERGGRAGHSGLAVQPLLLMPQKKTQRERLHLQAVVRHDNMVCEHTAVCQRRNTSV